MFPGVFSISCLKFFDSFPKVTQIFAARAPCTYKANWMTKHHLKSPTTFNTTLWLIMTPIHSSAWPFLHLEFDGMTCAPQWVSFWSFLDHPAPFYTQGHRRTRNRSCREHLSHVVSGTLGGKLPCGGKGMGHTRGLKPTWKLYCPQRIRNQCFHKGVQFRTWFS